MTGYVSTAGERVSEIDIWNSVGDLAVNISLCPRPV